MPVASPRTSSMSAAALRPTRVATAFRLVLSDKNVNAVLVNIFAGINRCDWVAAGVVKAVRETKLNGAAGRAARRHERRRGP